MTNGGNLMNNSGSMSFFTLLWAFVCLIFILVLAYFSVKLLSKKQRVSGAGKLIEVLAQVNIGQDKVLLVVKSADKTMLVGMSQNSISKICDLDDDYCKNIIEQNPTVPFSEVLKSSFNRNKVEKKDKGDGNV